MPSSPRVSATRPWVDAFADEMEAKLAQNRHKGDRDGWAKDSAMVLLWRLKQEVAELEHQLITDDNDGLVAECADVANFAMMIADVAGGMKPHA